MAVRGSLTQVLAFLAGSFPASALTAGAAHVQIDLSSNYLCGLGTYTAEGIKAIADAIRVGRSLTQINLSGNMLCGVWTGYDC
eukprot:3750111-Prymnesium_polylepis.1